ncbi:MAG: membrane lipoprotein lipid attachment site-containing protein [Bacteroidetes bacterium]|nr:membrane lipoprotein lipid attachment site-containing protein [Bacteroidota bacterium]
MKKYLLFLVPVAILAGCKDYKPEMERSDGT